MTDKEPVPMTDEEKEKYTVDNLRKALGGNEFAPLRCCSICNSAIGFWVDGNPEPVLDTNCDCVSYQSPPERRSWDDILENVLMQRWPENRLSVWNTLIGKESPR